jgi:ATP-dependent DNA helicase RecG
MSPGALPNSMTVEKMIAGQRSARNLIIVEVLRDYGYVDARGMGVRTKVIPALKARGLAPIFQATDDFVKTTIEKIKGQNDLKKLPLTRQKSKKGEEVPISGQAESENDLLKDLLRKHIDLINAIRENPDSDYKTLSIKVRVSETTVKRHIQKLKRAGILLRKGSRKTGHWEVIG